MRSDQHAGTKKPRNPVAYAAGNLAKLTRKEAKEIYGIDPDPKRQRATSRLRSAEPMLIVNKAREHTIEAIEKLRSLMNGEMPDGSEGMVPAAVQLRAAEVLIERGYGKSPQAILLKDDSGSNALSVHAVPILERIAQLKAARDAQGSVTDLEASEMTVIDEDTQPKGVLTERDETYTGDISRTDFPVTSKQIQPEDII
jgi:hypothetical protein